MFNAKGCGLCGDPITSPTPRAHELGGIYGKGPIAKTYQPGSYIRAKVELTANHMGDFTFDICNLDSTGGQESEDCFKQTQLQFSDGSNKYNIKQNIREFYPDIWIPANLTCEHCVLRWTYRGANNFGVCDDNTEKLGCGPQETFKACSDISIKA